VLTLLALSVAFALFGTMITLNAAYQRAIDDTRMDRLMVAVCLRLRSHAARLSPAAGAHPARHGGRRQMWIGGREQDQRHWIMVTLVDEGMRARGRSCR